MNTIVLAALALATAFPPMAWAQATQPPSPQPSARDGLNEQLIAIGARIDSRLERGRLSPEIARKAHLEVNDLQADVYDLRLRDGGQLSEADRFALKARINRLEDLIESERTGETSAQTHP